STADANSRGRPGRLEAHCEHIQYDLSDLKGVLSENVKETQRLKGQLDVLEKSLMAEIGAAEKNLITKLDGLDGKFNLGFGFLTSALTAVFILLLTRL
ncbi:MAG: hypothetical protein LBF41_00545, partial [Deltaproteobacteria bacterium]|nr:hypothetical protein [Deltaproteobacteria bacterium]